MITPTSILSISPSDVSAEPAKRRQRTRTGFIPRDEANSSARTRPYIPKTVDIFALVVQFVNDNSDPCHSSGIRIPRATINCSSLEAAIQHKVAETFLIRVTKAFLRPEFGLPRCPEITYRLLRTAMNRNIEKARTLLQLCRQSGFGTVKPPVLRWETDYNAVSPLYARPLLRTPVHICHLGDDVHPRCNSHLSPSLSSRVRGLAQVLMTDSSITRLKLPQLFTPAAARATSHLAEALRNSRSLQEVSITLAEGASFDALQIHYLLQHNTHLQSLDLTLSAPDTCEGKGLFEALQHNSTLTSLSFSRQIDTFYKICEATASESEAMQFVKALNTTLLQTTSLTSLILSHIGAIDFGKAISSALSCNNTLTHFSLRHTPQNIHGISALLTALETNTVLHHLDLTGSLSFYSPEYVQSVSDSLQRNTTLTTLILDENPFIPGPAALLIETLISASSTISTLSMTRCSLTPADGFYCADLLKTNTSLTSLRLQKNTLSNKALRSIGAALPSNRTLRHIDLRNQMDPEIMGRNNFFDPSEKVLNQFQRLLEEPSFPVQFQLDMDAKHPVSILLHNRTRLYRSLTHSLIQELD